MIEAKKEDKSRTFIKTREDKGIDTKKEDMSSFFWPYGNTILQHLTGFVRKCRVDELWLLKSLEGWILNILSKGGFLGTWGKFGKRAKNYMHDIKIKNCTFYGFYMFFGPFWTLLHEYIFFCPKSRFWVIGPKRCKKSEFRWCSATVNRIKIIFFCIFYDLYGFLIELFSGPGHRFRVSAIFDQMPRKIFFDVFLRKITKIYIITI